MPLSGSPPGRLPPAKRRRAHRKSRTGCLNCRNRRVKCGEERPRCQSCIRRDDSCQYPGESGFPQLANSEGSDAPDAPDAPDTPSVAVPTLSRLPTRTQHSRERSTVEHNQIIHSPGVTATPSSVSNISQPDEPPSTTFSIRDLALLHHWTVSTSVDMFKTPDINALWQITFLQVGFEHPFVVHVILALAALHKACVDDPQNKSYILEATQHHEKSLAGFRDMVEHFTEDKSEALLTWSILNVLYTFAISKQLAGGEERTSRHLRKDQLLGVEWIPMIRGVDAVLGPHYNFLRAGRMSSVISLGNWDELNPSDVIVDPVDKELQRIRDVWKDSNDAEIYEEALHIMRKCRMYILQFDTMDTCTLKQWGCNRAWAGPPAFIHFAPERYFALLHQRQPPALVLFAFCGAFFHMLDDYWFLKGWGRAIVEVVDDILGSYWRPWILWATSIAGLD